MHSKFVALFKCSRSTFSYEKVQLKISILFHFIKAICERKSLMLQNILKRMQHESCIMFSSNHMPIIWIYLCAKIFETFRSYLFFFRFLSLFVKNPHEKEPIKTKTHLYFREVRKRINLLLVSNQLEKPSLAQKHLHLEKWKKTKRKILRNAAQKSYRPSSFLEWWYENHLLLRLFPLTSRQSESGCFPFFVRSSYNRRNTFFKRVLWNECRGISSYTNNAHIQCLVALLRSELQAQIYPSKKQHFHSLSHSVIELSVEALLIFTTICV